MTDGIIQEVFSKYILLRTFSNEFKDIPKLDQLINDLQQELIEKIKKEPVTHWAREDWVSKKNLIGDNE